MNYRLSPAAQSDLEDVWVYIAQDDPQAADRFLDTIEEKLLMLATHPNMGRNCGRKCDELRSGVQRFPVGNHVVFYRLQPRHIDSILDPPEGA
jgi:toxin ParE1/3/4